RPFRGLLGVHSRCGLHTRAVTVYRDRYPGASDISSPPCLPRLLPAGAVAGWGLHPLEKRRLVTAHVASGPSARRMGTARLRRFRPFADERNRPGGPIVVIRQCSADHPERQPVVTRADHGIIRPESPKRMFWRSAKRSFSKSRRNAS